MTSCCVLDEGSKSKIVGSEIATASARNTTYYTTSIDSVTQNRTSPCPRPFLQQLPDELLLQILNYMPFRGLRALLHSPSARLARLARFRLEEVQRKLQSWPGATEATRFFGHKPNIAPWPPIEVAGVMFLGKEFCLVDRGEKDEFVSVAFYDSG